MRNNAPMRTQHDKDGPSGMSRNAAYIFPEKWGAKDYLMPVDLELVRSVKERVGGASLLQFTTQEFADQAEVAFNGLELSKLSFLNVWDVYLELKAAFV